MKMVEDSPVYVMQGTYSYIGTDGNTWKVEWYADETGYHPSAPFLPKSVLPNHPGRCQLISIMVTLLVYHSTSLSMIMLY